MKFKNIKTKKYKKKSPSNSRMIPELPKFSLPKIAFPEIDHKEIVKIYKGALRIFVILFFITTAYIVGTDLKDNYEKKKLIDAERGAILKDINYWENFISKNNNFPNAYVQLSALKYRLGDMSKAREYVRKALALDPGSKYGRQMEMLMK